MLEKMQVRERKCRKERCNKENDGRKKSDEPSGPRDPPYLIPPPTMWHHAIFPASREVDVDAWTPPSSELCVCSLQPKFTLTCVWLGAKLAGEIGVPQEPQGQPHLRPSSPAGPAETESCWNHI